MVSRRSRGYEGGGEKMTQKGNFTHMLDIVVFVLFLFLFFLLVFLLISVSSLVPVLFLLPSLLLSLSLVAGLVDVLVIIATGPFLGGLLVILCIVVLVIGSGRTARAATALSGIVAGVLLGVVVLLVRQVGGRRVEVVVVGLGIAREMERRVCRHCGPRRSPIQRLGVLERTRKMRAELNGRSEVTGGVGGRSRFGSGVWRKRTKAVFEQLLTALRELTPRGCAVL